MSRISQVPQYSIGETGNFVQAETDNNYEIRILEPLEGKEGEGFTLSCCFKVEIVKSVILPDKSRALEEGRVMVAKIFDYKLATQLRDDYGAGPFTAASMQAINKLADESTVVKISRPVYQRHRIKTPLPRVLLSPRGHRAPFVTL